jgi:hypothetical protein
MDNQIIIVTDREDLDPMEILIGKAVKEAQDRLHAASFPYVVADKRGK